MTTTTGTNPGRDALYPVMPNIQMTTLPRPDQPGGAPLLRETLGTVLRGLRGESGRTLRDVADAARVSPAVVKIAAPVALTGRTVFDSGGQRRLCRTAVVLRLPKNRQKAVTHVFQHLAARRFDRGHKAIEKTH